MCAASRLLINSSVLPVRRIQFLKKLTSTISRAKAISLCEQRISSGKVKIHAQFAEGLPPVRVSPSEAQQIFINLINNSLDAVESEGGTVKITSKKEGDFVVVDVADNGPGIPSYVLPGFSTHSLPPSR